MVENPTSKILVIDTEQYAGNFERQMCAYITGQIGDCEVGDEIAMREADNIKALEWWEDHIANEADDRGCYRPATIWATPGWFNNGMGKHYKVEQQPNKKNGYPAYLSVAIFVNEFPPEDVWQEFMQRAQQFAKNRKTIEARSYPIADDEIIITAFRQLQPIYELKEIRAIKVGS